MPVLLLLLGVGAVAAFAMSQGAGGGSATALPPDPRELENLIIIIAARKANADHRRRGSALADALGMPLTGIAIRGDVGLPKNENWVGTGIPVATYVQQMIARRKIEAAKKHATNIKNAYKGAKSTVKGVADFFKG